MVGGNWVRSSLTQGHLVRALKGLDLKAASADLADLPSLKIVFRPAGFATPQMVLRRVPSNSNLQKSPDTGNTDHFCTNNANCIVPFLTFPRLNL